MTKPEISACEVTPKGVAGIAVIQVAGEGALELVRRFFRGRTPSPGEKIYYGQFVDPITQKAVDDVLVTCYSPRESLVGQTLLDINCHGGKATIFAILKLLREYGVCIRSQDEWRGDLKSYSRRIENEALRHFLESQTPAAAKVFLWQMNGYLRRALHLIRDAIDSSSPALSSMRKLAESAPLGKALARPMQIVLVGKPNTGKSTLLNRLLQRDRVIIDAIPGTTRDTVRESVAIGEIPFCITDTAGLRKSCDKVEQLGIERAKAAIESADRVIWLCDVTCSLQEEPAPKNAIVALNKIDFPQNHLEQYRRRFPLAVAISALTGAGMDALKNALLSKIPDVPTVPAPVVFTPFDVKMLKFAAKALESNSPQEARLYIDRCLQ